MGVQGIGPRVNDANSFLLTEYLCLSISPIIQSMGKYLGWGDAFCRANISLSIMLTPSLGALSLELEDLTKASEGSVKTIPRQKQGMLLLLPPPLG